MRIHQDSDFIIKLAYHCHLKTGSIDKAVSMRGVHDDNRITKIKLYSKIYNERQYLLWNSLATWSKNKSIGKKYLEHVKLNKKSFQLATQHGISKYIGLFTAVLTNPKILKTRYRFAYLKK